MKGEILRVLDAARMVVDDIYALLDSRRVPDAHQLRTAAGSIPANIREAYGRDAGPDRKRFLGYARGSAEETNERLRVAYAGNFVPVRRYWTNHHRLVTIVRMLDSLLEH
jgi:four helix bundle protein